MAINVMKMTRAVGESAPIILFRGTRWGLAPGLAGKAGGQLWTSPGLAAASWGLAQD